jgi:oligopeptide transport system permease protein
VKDKNHTRKFWKRLKKNKPAVVGMILILLSFFIAAFAYVLAPDGSPNANRIIAELSNKKPGYSIDVLRVKNEVNINTSFLTKLWQGAPENFTLVPITSHTETKDSVIIQKFIDEGISERRSYHKSQLAEQPVKRLKYYLGSDKFGRDILSRLLVGTRVSLSVGLIALLFSLTIGILLGSIAGYFRGKWDDVIMWFINVVWSVPTLLLVFAITLVLGKGFWQVFIAVGLTMWVNVARLVRGQVLSLREMQFIEATKALGFSNARIILKHVLPNIIGPVMVIAAGNFASAIVIEAGLSFLGVGVQPPQPSWGLMIKENYNFIITNNPLLALIPGVAIMLLVLAFNLLGNGLRDAFNVKGRTN